MLEQNDICTLSRHRTVLGKVVEWVVLIVPVVLIVLANMNLSFAVRLGVDVGYNLEQMLQDWLNGVDADARYPGTYIIAMDLLKTGFVQLAGALVLAVVAWSYLSTRKMHERILEALKDSGALREQQ